MNDLYFDNLSDVELRQELQKYGFPNMPVTETTRNLLIKRLKNHVLNGSSATKSSRSNRRSLQSSTNSSRKQTSSPGRRTNASPSRRQTIAATVSAATYTNNNVNKNIQEHPTVAVSSNSNRDYYLSNEGRSYLNRDYDSYSNNRPLSSHLTVEDTSYSNSPSNSKYASKLSPKTSPKIYVPPPIMSSDMPHFNASRVDTTTRISREPERTPMRNGKEMPGVVSRLLKLRNITIGRSHTNTPYTPSTTNHFYLSDSDSDSGSPTRYSSSFNRRPNRTFSDNLWNRLNIKNKFKQSSVPYLLITCLGLFFLVLAVLYMTKPPDMPSTMLEKSTTFTLCEDLSSVAKPSINCIDNELLGPSLALNKELIQLLQTNIEAHYCREHSVSPEVTGTEFMKYLYKKRTTDAHKLLKSFHAALYLIEHNPQWKIQILSRRSEGPQQLPDIYKQDIQFGLLKPYLPLKCILFNKMQRFFLIIGSVFLVALLVGAVFVMWRFWNQRRQFRLKTVENFTKEIVKELIHRATLKDETQGEIIVNHLRDKLIPLNKRKSLLWAWNEALQKLEASDSRIQFGCILQNGEEFRTMKWVESILSTSMSSASSSSPSTSALHQDNSDHRLKKKHWQSPAFDNVNKISDPPTPCLKIRHMFDAAEANLPDLKQNIIESILEKVGPQCRIYDIQLDRQSCCVYIRCASEKDAGIVHNEINGWWFDNRLVSIKFLRLQRYLVRFPNSTSIVPITIKNSK
ncbi:inner nuclear membrane protein Man1 [Lucilia cuprina]|uniref:inner nuclear membrane protein Man1 n=1 Tax=Lucilia cuprina TaxID=7375 RepID=UPI001F05B0CC|nr:inner nuclear membrane protein Man1 [Lucilia cuprina]